MSIRLRVNLLLAVVLLAFYLATLGWRAVVLIADGGAVPVLLGLALLALAGIGVWATVAEFRFGLAAARLGRRLGEQAMPTAAPDAELPRRPSGRIDRQGADAVFERYRAAVEADRADWRGWYRLGVAYDLAGDRRRARAAIRAAIRLADEPKRAG